VERGFIGSAVARICPEEIAFNAAWIHRDQLIDFGERLGNSSDGQYLMRVATTGSPAASGLQDH
jgi:dTDP-glucose pyrophosphorylase